MSPVAQPVPPSLPTSAMRQADRNPRRPRNPEEGGPVPAGPGTVYLLHFDVPYRHARHYLGWARDVEARLAEHAAGRGARLTAVVSGAGIGWVLARTWPGGRVLERSLKRHHHAPRLCPLCASEAGAGPGQSPVEPGLAPGLPTDREQLLAAAVTTGSGRPRRSLADLAATGRPKPIPAPAARRSQAAGRPSLPRPGLTR
jgi:hypothetical protein